MTDFDLVIAASMAGGGDRGLRIALEARHAWSQGLRVGLVNLMPEAGGRIDPDIQACVTRGLAHPIGPGDEITSERLTLHCEGVRPRTLADFPVRAGQIEVVVDDPAAKNPKALHRWLERRADHVVWVARNERLARAMASHRSDVPVSDRLWAPMVAASPGFPRSGRKLSVGHIGSNGLAWPSTIEELVAIFPPDGSVDVLFLDPPPENLLRFPHRWELFERGEISLLRFLERLDALVIIDPEPDRAPETAVAWMLANGRAVFAPPDLAAALGLPGVVPTESRNVMPALRRRMAEAAGGSADSGAVPPTRPTAARRSPRRAPAGRALPALFVASNGIGLGHVTRLLAIARRCTAIEPVFVTQSPVTALVESYGFTAHYLPSPKYLSAAMTDWDAWFQVELEALIDLTNARLVAYDGNALTGGLVDAAGSRGTELVWVRGGMLGATRVPTIANDRFCDLVVEPGELAGAMDKGATRPERGRVELVDPILLLDREELIPRDEARRSLGLDPERPAVLIQLGSTTNRDVAAIIDQLVPALRRQDGLQIMIADWYVGDGIEPVWEGARLLRGHPFSRYFHAFDFSFAAAGYNTFHEVVGAELPTVFIANQHRSMDDQDGRSRFAEDEGFALRLDAETMPQLDEMVAVLMSADARAYLKRKCRNRQPRNGAVTAARLISDLAARDAPWTRSKR